LRGAGFSIPEQVELSALWPLLIDLAGSDQPVHITERLSAVLGDAWGAGRCIGIQGVLRGAVVAVAPVPAPDGPVGLFVLLAERPWPEQTLRGVCAHTAVALANVFHQIEAQQYAEIDPETWVSNRRAFEDAAIRELQRAARYGHALSIVVVEPGETDMPRAMLRTIATYLSRTVRTSDKVGRLTGHRFALLLAETDAAGAWRVIERLREHAGDDAPLLVTAPATFPADGQTWPELLECSAGRLTPLRGPADAGSSSSLVA
jgi:GGDEF domain-containing protein